MSNNIFFKVLVLDELKVYKKYRKTINCLSSSRQNFVKNKILLFIATSPNRTQTGKFLLFIRFMQYVTSIIKNILILMSFHCQTNYVMTQIHSFILKFIQPIQKSNTILIDYKSTYYFHLPIHFLKMGLISVESQQPT